MTPLEELLHQMGRWKAEIIRLATTIPDTVGEAEETKALEGVSFLQMLTNLRTRVTAHLQNKNIHNLTTEQLGIARRAKVDEWRTQRQEASVIPISKIPRLVAGVNNVSRALSTQPAVCVYHGMRFTVPALNTTLATHATQYHKLKFIRDAQGVPISVEHLINTSDVETDAEVIVGKITYLASTYTLQYLETVRIGQYRVSTILRGGTIPATSGSPAVPTSLPTSWFQ